RRRWPRPGSSSRASSARASSGPASGATASSTADCGTMTDLAELGAAQYVLLTTFRRDGRAVPTPLWVARDADALVVWTPADAGKVKRLRNRADVTVAPCTFRGEPTGPSVVGTATVLDPEA